MHLRNKTHVCKLLSLKFYVAIVNRKAVKGIGVSKSFRSHPNL